MSIRAVNNCFKGLGYNPIPNVYCPPILHPHIQFSTFPVMPQHTHLMGLIIGKNGIHFKNITMLSGTVYIYYRHEYNLIEIWGNPYNISLAVQMLQFHIQNIIVMNI
jgi:hypothetical protein